MLNLNLASIFSLNSAVIIYSLFEQSSIVFLLFMHIFLSNVYVDVYRMFPVLFILIIIVLLRVPEI